MEEFEVGDKVECINSNGTMNGLLVEGEVYEVIKVFNKGHGDGLQLRLKDVHGGPFAKRFVKIKKEGGNKVFEVGDKVEAVKKGKRFREDGVVIGNEYTVTSVREHEIGIGKYYVHKKECFKKINNKTTNKEVVAGKTLVKNFMSNSMSDIEQDTLCKFCKDVNDNPYGWHCEGSYCHEAIEAYQNENNLNENKEEVMININSTVAKVFTDIPEAALITKHLGQEYEEGSHKDYIALRDHKDEILEEARRLQEEEEKKAAKE